MWVWVGFDLLTLKCYAISSFFSKYTFKNLLISILKNNRSNLNVLRGYWINTFPFKKLLKLMINSKQKREIAEKQLDRCKKYIYTKTKDELIKMKNQLRHTSQTTMTWLWENLIKFPCAHNINNNMRVS